MEVIKYCLCFREGIVLPDVIWNDGLKENLFSILAREVVDKEESQGLKRPAIGLHSTQFDSIPIFDSRWFNFD